MANINRTEHDSLSMYLREIEKIPLLSRDEEFDLAMKARKEPQLVFMDLLNCMENKMKVKFRTNLLL